MNAPSPSETNSTPSEAEGPKGERIAKLLARAGVASRRDVERMIEDGRISLNGEVLTTPATILTNLDGVLVDEKPVQNAEPTRLFVFHKPVGLITAERDPAGRPTIYAALRNALPDGTSRMMPIGRLDLNTEGLLLLTNDGELKRAMELPSTGIPRTYRARTFGDITQSQLEELMHGVTIDGFHYNRIDANMERRTGRNQWIQVTLTEGKNREVRNVLEHLGLQVSRLMRTNYGPFELADLPRGGAVEIRPADVERFCKSLKSKGYIPQSIAAPRFEPKALPNINDGKNPVRDSRSDDRRGSNPGRYERGDRNERRDSNERSGERPFRAGRSERSGEERSKPFRSDGESRYASGNRRDERGGERSERPFRTEYGERSGNKGRSDRPARGGDRPDRGPRAPFRDRTGRPIRSVDRNAAHAKDTPRHTLEPIRGTLKPREKAPEADGAWHPHNARENTRTSAPDRGFQDRRGGFGGDRPDRGGRPSYGDRPDRGPRGPRPDSERRGYAPREGGDRGSYESRGRGGPDRGPRGPRPDGERRSYAPREGGERGSYESRGRGGPDRGGNREGGERKSFGRPDQGRGGYNSDRAPRGDYSSDRGAPRGGERSGGERPGGRGGERSFSRDRNQGGGYGESRGPSRGGPSGFPRKGPR